jgi:hypothetical protein
MEKEVSDAKEAAAAAKAAAAAAVAAALKAQAEPKKGGRTPDKVKETVAGNDSTLTAIISKQIADQQEMTEKNAARTQELMLKMLEKPQEVITLICAYMIITHLCAQIPHTNTG